MPTPLFQPVQIIVEESVKQLPLTEIILQKFHKTPIEFVSEIKPFKKQSDFNRAKKTLLLTRMRADPLKEFKAMSESSKRPYYALNLISNCHLECTYCILQSYLSNNPSISIFTNIEEILEKLEEQLWKIPSGSIVSTGKMADSLALEEISEHHRFLIPFFSKQKRVQLELKTKSDQISSLLSLPHNHQTVVSWSLNPETIIEREEYKTASFKDRVQAAQKATQAGYPVGFHFDPVILYLNWKEDYQKAIQQLFKSISPESIAWISVGTLRFPSKQKKIIEKRFPKNSSLLNGLLSSSRTFLHYSDQQREEVHQFLESILKEFLPQEKIYRCMDFEPIQYGPPEQKNK